MANVKKESIGGILGRQVKNAGNAVIEGTIGEAERKFGRRKVDMALGGFLFGLGAWKINEALPVVRTVSTAVGGEINKVSYDAIGKPIDDKVIDLKNSAANTLTSVADGLRTNK